MDLQKSNVGSECAAALAAALPSTEIWELNLSVKKISSEGAVGLAAALPREVRFKFHCYWFRRCLNKS